MAFCTNCGHTLEENQKFCTKCGKLVTAGINNEVFQSEKAEVETFRTQESNILHTAKTPGSAFKKPWVIALLSTVCLLAILTGVFLKQLKGGFYLVRYNLEKDTSKKFDYSSKAIANLNISSTYNAFIASSMESIKRNPDKVEAKLDELKSTIKTDDYKELKILLCNEKIASSASYGSYEEALAALIKLQQNGGNIKAVPKYEAIMLNIASKSLGINVYNNKADLKEKANVIFYNCGDNTFEELIEIKDLSPSESYEKQYDINLYKLTNGKYTKVSLEKTLPYNHLVDFGIYSYDKNKNGLFISLTETGYTSTTNVYKIVDDRFELVGAVGSSDPCTIQDFDNDGVFEVVTTELYDPYGQYSHADMPRITKYYKFSDSSKPTVAKEDRSAVAHLEPPVAAPAVQVSQQNSEYIFSDSSTRYLTDNEVSSLSKEQLGYARNEIYARHGYVFKTEKYAQYFSSKSWYKPNPSFIPGDEYLNQYEIKNYMLIQKYEK